MYVLLPCSFAGEEFAGEEEGVTGEALSYIAGEEEEEFAGEEEEEVAGEEEEEEVAEEEFTGASERGKEKP